MSEHFFNGLLNRLMNGDSTQKVVRTNYSPLTEEKWLCLSTALFHTTHVQSLKLARSQLNERAVSLLAPSISQQHLITVCDVSENHLLDEGAIILLRALNRVPKLEMKDLDLSRTVIGPETVRVLGDLLRSGNWFHRISLSENYIGDSGCEYLSAALPSTHVKCLLLDNCSIGDRGAMALAATLQQNCNLESLVLSSNRIGDDGLCALAEVLPTLQLNSISLSGNTYGSRGFLAIIDGLTRQSTLTQASLSFRSNIGREAVQAVTNMLQINTKLKYLELPRLQLDEEAIEQFLEALQYNSTFCSLIHFLPVQPAPTPAQEKRLLQLIEGNAEGIRHTEVEYNKVNRTIRNVWQPRIVQEKFTFERSLWPSVFSKAGSQHPAHLFYCLKETSDFWLVE